jgi:hypothetical protein
MHEHTTSTVETFLDEAIGGGKELQQVLVVDVVNLDHQMLEGFEKVPV